jgi:hypothetical protein
MANHAVLVMFFIGMVTAQNVPQIPAARTAHSSGTSAFVQGAGIVNSGARQNFFHFQFQGVLNKGDKIGFYIWDQDQTSASKSHSSEYACGFDKTKLRAPLLSIDPSTEFNASSSSNHTVSVSPTRTPFFSGMPQGRYKLCYCKKPPQTEENPSGECRAHDYVDPLGVFLFYDVPAVRQRKAVNSQRAFSRFVFNIHSGSIASSLADNYRVVVPDLSTSQVPGMGRGCSGTNWFTGPSWSTDTSGATTQSVPLIGVRSSVGYDEVAFHLPTTSTSSSPIPQGIYSVCLCDATNIGTGSSITDCKDLNGLCANKNSCPLPQAFPIEIATVFVHDLAFLVAGGKQVFSVQVLPVKNSISFQFSQPTSVFSKASKFWFTRSSVECGSGSHTSASAVSTLPSQWQQAGIVSDVDFSSITPTTVLDPLRVCIQLSDSSVIDVDNVVVQVAANVNIAFGQGALNDKISDHNQVGLRPGLNTGIPNSLYQKTVGTPQNDNGLWFSENFVQLQLSWNSSAFASSDQVYAVKSEYSCHTTLAETYEGIRSAPYTIKADSSAQRSVTFPLDLGFSLFNSTYISNASAGTQPLAPATGTDANSNSSLYSDYKLCASCPGCDAFGVELGTRFRVLAALHVYQDTGFEKPYRFATSNQRVVIATGVVPQPALSVMFLTTDQLWFSDSQYPCFDWNQVGYNSNSSTPVYGNRSVYQSPGNKKLLNAFEYVFDFSSISSLPRMVKLCVKRDNDLFEFPGCSLTVIAMTSSPSVAVAGSLNSRTYGAVPQTNPMQTFVLKSVYRGTTNQNQITWAFTGTISAADRLGISAVHTGTTGTTECGPDRYIYATTRASQLSSGTTTVSPAQSGFLNGMVSGQYALCYCNVDVSVNSVKTPLVTCRTAKDFSQFVGFVYFDGIYSDATYVRSFAATVNYKQTFKFKMIKASSLDRIMLVAPTDTCGSGVSRNSAITTTTFKSPAIPTPNPTSASEQYLYSVTYAPTTRSPTRAPSTKNPTFTPTRVPSKAPTTLAPQVASPGTKSPVTKAPLTRAPTRAPTTLTPTTVVPTEAPTTSFPTKAPTARPTKNPNARISWTRAPTQSELNQGHPYVLNQLTFTSDTAGNFKICYCWHNIYGGPGQTRASRTQNYNGDTALKFPTAAPTTRGPTRAPTTRAPVSGGRRLLWTNVAVNNFDNTTSSSSCLANDYQWERRFGVEFGFLLVHDLFLVSGFTNGSPVKALRLAVRAVNNQKLRFTGVQTFFPGSNTAYFIKYSSNCSDSTGRTNVLSNFGATGSYQISASFDFSAYARSCSSGQRNLYYLSVEEQFFFRLCVREGSSYSQMKDFRNVMVTVTDINIVFGYENPVVTSSSLKPQLKFNDACGFLWSERLWKIATQFRFVAQDKECGYQSNNGNTRSSADYTISSVNNANGGEEYRMYEGSLIKFFLDDTDYTSLVWFGAVPRRRVPYRLCMLPHGLGFNAYQNTATVSEIYWWIDYPDVALYPVNKLVSMTAKASNWATNTGTSQCPPGLLGCQCLTGNTCNTKNYYKCPNENLPKKASCSNNVCYAACTPLYGAYNDDRSNAPYSNAACQNTGKPCDNPGPTAVTASDLLLEFDANDINSGDKIKFVQSSQPCTHTVGTSPEVSGAVNLGLVRFDFSSMASSTFYRMCITTNTGFVLDYSGTGFTFTSVQSGKTTSPTRSTMKPTLAKRIGFGTYAPTPALPSFANEGEDNNFNIQYPKTSAGPETYAYPWKRNVLHITQTESNTQTLYTQFTNFTQGTVKAGDTLRVYRYSAITPPNSNVDYRSGIINCAKPLGGNGNSLDALDLVMEVPVNSALQDVSYSNTNKVVNSAQFPPLPRGYYTVCYCRKTTSQRCQMSTAGFVFSSAARKVSVIGSGAKDTSFYVTPLLDYPTTVDLFNVSKTIYIVPQFFCLSRGSDCTECAGQGLTNQLAEPEFTIELTNGLFPLKITNKIEHSASTSSNFNLCFHDPFIPQYSVRQEATGIEVQRTNINFTDFTVQPFMLGLIGHVYISDLTFQWEHNGGFTLKRTHYSVAQNAIPMIIPYYTTNAKVIANTDKLWFTALEYDCSVKTSIAQASTSEVTVPTSGIKFITYFTTVSAGRFYRICVQNSGTVRDFGSSFGVWVTDIVASATSFSFFKAFQLTLTSTADFQVDDEFFLLHVSQMKCSDYTNLKAGYVSPNMGVWGRGNTHNMGKMPQITWTNAQKYTVTASKICNTDNNGGEKRTGTVTADACERLCDADSGCTAYDFKYVSNANECHTYRETTTQVTGTDSFCAVKSTTVNDFTARHENIPFGFADYRLCVKRTQDSEVSYLDYTGVRFSPQGSNHILNPQVAKQALQTVRILSGVDRAADTRAAHEQYNMASFTIQLGDIVWFTRSDTKCTASTWNSNTNQAVAILSQGSATTSSRVTVGTSHYKKVNSRTGSYLELTFDFQNTDVSSTPFRLCVERVSWKYDDNYMPITQNVVQEFRDVQLTVTTSTTLTTTAPTQYSQLASKATTKPSTNPTRADQISTVYSGASSSQIKWEFSGSVDHTTDKIAVAVYQVAAPKCEYGGGNTYFSNPVLVVPAALGTGSTSPATTPTFGSLSVGKYTVCYCQASTSVTGDCSTELGWRQTVGYLYSIAVTVHDVTVSKLSSSSSSFTVWFNQQTTNQMKFMAIDDTGSCGNTAASTKVDRLDYKALTPKQDPSSPPTPTPVLTGLMVTAAFSQSTVGSYKLCLCLSACSLAAPNFGGEIANLVVHDITLNGQSTSVTLSSLVSPRIANLTITQSTFTAGQDSVWFARNGCGQGDHAVNSNFTEKFLLPVSGGNVVVNYTLAQPSMVTHKLCVKVNSTQKVFSFSSLGFLVTDVSLTDTSPFTNVANAPIGISYHKGLQQHPTDVSKRLVFFRQLDQSCEAACPASGACTITKNQWTSSSQSVPAPTPPGGSPSPLNFDFRTVTPLKAFRLCVLLDKDVATKTFIDLSDIRVYPVPSDTDFFVRSGAALYQDQYQVYLKTPVSGVGTPTSQDQLYFRRSDLSCLQTKPSAADVTTSSTFVFQSASAPVVVDFAKLNATDINHYRLCVYTSDKVTLDYNTKKLYMTKVVVSTKFCRAKSSIACKVSLSVQAPDGFFSATGNQGSSAIRVWYQRYNPSNPDCGQDPGGVSTVDSSQSNVFDAATGSVSLSFQQVTPSLNSYLQLCVRNSNLQVTAMFPVFPMYVLDVGLTTSPGSAVPLTQYLTPQKSAVGITASLTSVPYNSLTWFLRSSESCAARQEGSAASATQTNVVKITQSLAAGAMLTYDFSLVRPAQKEMLGFRLCYSVNDKLIDASTVEVFVLEYTVTPAFVGTGTFEQVSVYPGTEVGISAYAFCKQDVPCPNLNQMYDYSTVNCSGRCWYSPSSSCGIPFDKIVNPSGGLLKLCGVRQNVATPVDLSPKGVFQGIVELDRTVIDKTQKSNAIQIKWANTLQGSNGTTDYIWFQVRDKACTATSLQVAADATASVPVKASPFTANFDFSQITSDSTLKLCAHVGGVLKDFTETTISLMSVTLGATSVTAAKDQSFVVNYNSVAALGNTVSAFMSSSPSCASGSSTPSIASVSGKVHSFDFSQQTPSMNKWYLCLKGNATLNIDFASVYLVDIGDLGKKEVQNAPGQVLTLVSTVSLADNDVVWFSSPTCDATNERSSNVTYIKNTNTYSFDFSGVTPSLSTRFTMCVARNSNALLQYSSSSVMVVPQLVLGGPYMAGSRTLDQSSLSNFVGNSQMAFVPTTVSCENATFVSATTTTHDLSVAGTYRLCVKQQDGTITDISSASFLVQSCADICTTDRSSGSCDQVQGTCASCTPHFTGDRCEKCAAGYTGANCDVCDVSKDYHCDVAVAGQVAGFCSLNHTCSVCSCNGHYDVNAQSRCPGNVCVCQVGYTGNACQSCSQGYYKSVNNATGTFTCSNCADKCFKRASSCSATQCQCVGNFDPQTDCQNCIAGHVLNVTLGTCVATSSPTTPPTPGVPCAGLSDVEPSTKCSPWVYSFKYCNDAQYSGFMKENCALTCCQRTVEVNTMCSNVSDNSTHAKNCGSWASAGYCNSYQRFMDSNCAMSCCELKVTGPTSSPTTMPPTSPQSSTCSGKTNKQTEATCSSYSEAGYCSSYSSWMTQNCELACCNRALALQPASSCSGKKDASPPAGGCASYAIAGYCTSYKDWMTQNCDKTCCDSQSCVDGQANCGSWAQNGYCQTTSQYYGYMSTTCKKACKIC